MVRGSRRGFVLGTAVLVLAAPGLFSPGAVGRSANRAAVVVQHGNPIEGGAECVVFTEDRISGFDLMERSGFEYLAAQFSFGRAMCWLDAEGCETTDPDECFCEAPVRSWSLWVQQQEQQLPSPADTGADESRVTDGTVHYWVWGPFGEPPLRPTSVEDVCAAQGVPDSSAPTHAASDEHSPAGSPARVAGEIFPLPATR